MDLRQHFRFMAGWHRWAFEQLYAVVDGLDEEKYRRDAGLFFKSVHGTLNHMLLVEHMWRGRLIGELFGVKSLGDEIEPDRARLRERIHAHAALWAPTVDALTDVELGADFTYRSLKGDVYRMPRASIVHTLFTHGAHHRGQITAALTQWGHEAPVMDFPYFFASLPKDGRHPMHKEL
jgi:uncharacterized damage-inducible protein DinB